MTALPARGDRRAVDQAKIDALASPGADPTLPRRPQESRVVRLIIALLALFWLAAIALIMLVRVVRGHRPVLVLHARCGYGRRTLFVPKIATSTVSGNAKHLAGLVEVATGTNDILTIDGKFEHWLRATGLDELPQLFLVVVGKMRLVGPRPVTETELDEMALDAHGRPQPVAVDTLQPGLVGLWQILDRHAYELDERNELDMRMVTTWSRRACFAMVACAAVQVVRRLVGGGKGTISQSIDLRSTKRLQP